MEVTSPAQPTKLEEGREKSEKSEGFVKSRGSEMCNNVQHVHVYASMLLICDVSLIAEIQCNSVAQPVLEC